MSIRIGIGNALSPSMPAQDVWRWAEYCDESGIDSIWVSDQLLGPTLEPLALLAALAARTGRLRIGTNVLVIPFREPLLLAKQLASIDLLSDGRLLPAFGVGSALDPVWKATARNPSERGKEADEAIALVRALLSQDEVTFAGEHFQYEGSGIQPRRGHCPPLWIGGDSKAAIRRTATYGDGWIGGLAAPEKAGQIVAEIKSQLSGTGRTIDPDHFGVTIPFRIGGKDDPSVKAARERFASRIAEPEREAAMRAFAIGEADEIIELVEAFIGQDVAKFVAMPIAGNAQDLMEQTRLLRAEIVPAIENRSAAAA